MSQWSTSRHLPYRNEYVLWHGRHRTHITSQTPELLEDYTQQLNTNPNPKQIVIRFKGYFRIYLPLASPIGCLPNNFTFPGYISPFTQLAYEGIENFFQTEEVATILSNAYPNLQQSITNQTPTTYRHLDSLSRAEIFSVVQSTRFVRIREDIY